MYLFTKWCTKMYTSSLLEKKGFHSRKQTVRGMYRYFCILRYWLFVRFTFTTIRTFPLDPINRIYEQLFKELTVCKDYENFSAFTLKQKTLTHCLLVLTLLQQGYTYCTCKRRIINLNLKIFRLLWSIETLKQLSLSNDSHAL